MLSDIFASARTWQKLVINLISYFMLCVATIAFLLCILSFIICRVDTPDYILMPLTTLSLILASFLDSYFLGKLFKEKGILTGIITGGIFCILIIALAIYYDTLIFSEIFFTKISSVLIAGMIGGILGVN